jgi:type II restriction enzyme
MNLQCEIDLAASYKSGSQIARILSEGWCHRELYCPACDSNRILPSKANTPAIDFSCPRCKQHFQLKSSRTWNSKKIVDAGYEAMIRAIREDRTPHLLLLQYTHEWSIQNVLLIPRMFFTESVIQRRRPLSSTARRAGWVGCNILLSSIPNDGKIAIVSSGVPEPKQQVRQEFKRVRGLDNLPPSLRGWTVDVLNSIRRLRKSQFSLQEIYGVEEELQAAHPDNRNVRAKIRQQLQVLRDLGLIKFHARGNYSLCE